MPLSTYDELQTSILSWLARPGDPLVSPAVPDMIQLFEREATRRLKVGGAEKRASLTALSAAVALPADFDELRLATSGGVVLSYVTPMQLPNGGGPPAHYTIVGNELRLGPSPSGGCTIEIVYQSGVPPLSDANPSNWLLAQHPDCYLFGSLVEAESFIGSDDRIPLWAQRREAAFSSIESADRKARWGGAPLSIRAEGVSGGNGTAAGDWTSAPPVPIPIASIVAGDGLTGGGTEGIVTLALSTPVTVGRGGTGGTNALDARANLGAAPLDSPALIGNPTAPTPAPSDNDTSIATTGFVTAALTAQALAGDVTGPTSTTAVVRLQGRPVAATAPTSLQVLQWSGTNWAPATIAAGGTLTGITAGTGVTVSGTAPSPTVALTVPVAVANGGTGATTAGAALTALGAAPLASPAFTGTPSLPTGTTAVTQTAGTSNTTVATTAFVATSFAPLNAPVFTGDARAVTPATADNDTSIATTAYVQAQGYATSAAMTTAVNLRVLKAGDTMTGNLIVNPGLVGIGTASPGAGLHVSAGDISNLAYFSGTVRAIRIGATSTTASIDCVDMPVTALQPLTISGSSTLMVSTSGVAVGSPTGGALGIGKLNAVEVRANNVVLTSDAGVKTDIGPLPPGLPLVAAIEPKAFHWQRLPDLEITSATGEAVMIPSTAPDFTTKLNRGFIAQDVANILGGAVEDGVDLGGLVAVLWQAVRELAAEVAQLKAGVSPRSRGRGE